MAYKVFTNGSVLNASEVNDNLMNQAVITFTNSTARSSAITSPVEGMVTYLADTNAFEFWDGAAWSPLGARPSFVGFGANNSSVSMTTSTWTAMPYTTELFDTDNFHDNVTNNTRITIPAGKGGFYQFSGHMTFSDNGSGVRAVDVWKNGTSLASFAQLNGSSGGVMRIPIASVGEVAEGDYIEFMGIQTSGSTLTIGSAFRVSYLGA